MWLVGASSKPSYQLSIEWRMKNLSEPGTAHFILTAVLSSDTMHQNGIRPEIQKMTGSYIHAGRCSWQCMSPFGL